MAANVIRLQVVPTGDGAPDDEALAESALALGRDLAELDVEEVVPASAGGAPPGTKGVELLALGGLLVRLGRSTGVLGDVVDAIPATGSVAPGPAASR